MKLYLVTRSDLAFEVRAVQLCHALREFGARHPEADKEWYEKSNTLVLLEVGNEAELEKLLHRASKTGARAAEFREPDLGNALTAAAFGPEAKPLCRSLKLALRQPHVLQIFPGNPT